MPRELDVNKKKFFVLISERMLIQKIDNPNNTWTDGGDIIDSLEKGEEINFRLTFETKEEAFAEKNNLAKSYAIDVYIIFYTENEENDIQIENYKKIKENEVENDNIVEVEGFVYGGD